MTFPPIQAKTVPLGAENKAYVGQARPSSLPSWVPTVGTIADVSLNVVADVMPGVGVFGWGGVFKASWRGTKGSLICTCGGHTDGPPNGQAEYDLGTRLWSVLKASGPTFSHSDTYATDDATGWNWAATSGTAVQVGQSGAGHLYCNTVAVPPNVFPNTPNGALVKMGTSTLAYGGQRGTNRIHVCGIGDDLWTNPFNLSTAIHIGPGCTLYDSLRNRVVMFAATQGGANQSYEWLEAGTSNQGTVNTSGITDAYYAKADYMAADDLYMLFRMDTRQTGPGGKLRIIDPKTNAYYLPTCTGTLPDGWGGGLDWCEEERGITYFDGSKVYFYKAPANPRTGTWACSLVADFGNTARPNSPQQEYFGRAMYSSVLKSIAWLNGYNTPVQLGHLALP